MRCIIMDLLLDSEVGSLAFRSGPQMLNLQQILLRNILCSACRRLGIELMEVSSEGNEICGISCTGMLHYEDLRIGQ